MIVGLTGYAQVGKDLGASFLVEKGFKRLAFADILRQSLYNLNPIVMGIPGWDESDLGTQYSIVSGYKRVRDLVDALGWDVVKVKYPEVRELLQRFGTEVGRDLYGESFWVDRVINQIEDDEYVVRNGFNEVVYRAGEKNYVITDVRFPNEEKAVHAIGGRVFRITRPGTGAVNTHVSDTGVDKLLVDGIIPNTGTIERYREMVLEAVGID